MWKLKSAEESENSPLLRSLNNFEARQVWAWDAHAGSEQERAAIREAQAQFSANRHDQSHSADLLLRLQQTGSVENQSKDRGFSAPIGKTQPRHLTTIMPITPVAGCGPHTAHLAVSAAAFSCQHMTKGCQ